jgi:hypothetical protein
MPDAIIVAINRSERFAEIFIWYCLNVANIGALLMIQTSKFGVNATRKQSQCDLMFDSDASSHLTAAELLESLFLVTMFELI